MELHLFNAQFEKPQQQCLFPETMTQLFKIILTLLSAGTIFLLLSSTLLLRQESDIYSWARGSSHLGMKATMSDSLNEL